MTDQGEGVWFRVRRRRLGWGYNYIPVTWQGWATALGLGPVIVATVFAGDPSTLHTHNPVLFLKAKLLLGLGGAHLPQAMVAALIVGEVMAFVVLLLWKSRSLRPLD